MSDTCTRRKLASSSACTLQLCDCGTVHLELGPTTFRMDPETARHVAAAFAAAVRQLGALGCLEPASANAGTRGGELPH